MKQLKVRDALSQRFVIVPPQACVSAVLDQVEEKRATHCALVDPVSGQFLGLVRLADVSLANTQAVFAELRPAVQPPALQSETLLGDIAKLVSQQGVDAFPVMDVQGNFVAILTHESLVQTLLRAEKETLEKTEVRVHQREERLRLAAMATNDSVWDLNPVTRELWTTENINAGLAGEGMLTDLDWWRERLYYDDRDRVMLSLQEAIQGDARNWQSEFRYRRSEGGYAFIMIRCYIERTVTGEATRVIGVMTDITERVQLEAQLRQAQKMEAIGHLSGGVAHDFNNLITVIQGSTDLINFSDNVPPDIRPWLDEIISAAGQASKLTRQLLAFGRKQNMQPKEVNLNVLIGRSVRLLRRTLGENILLEFRELGTPATVYVDEVMLEQVLINMAVNARDAMKKGGRLTIRLGSSEVVTGSAADPERKPGSYYTISVTDTGCGIDAKVLSRVFEPFFTTKGPEQGFGLGLSTAYGIVRQHQGWIDVESTVGVGTTFRVYLPVRVPESAPAVELAKKMAQVAGGTETILMVEDELPVRQLARVVLERYGYCVLEAGSGPEALDIWQEHRKEIDLLLTDMVMPGGMTGHDLANLLRLQRDDLKVLYVSGYSPENTGLQDVISRGSGSFLAKPFHLNELAKAVRECLG
jgi:two-component system cell cycle sensor histidine kinase/response regulator CckA